MTAGSANDTRRLRTLLSELDVVVFEAEPATGRFALVTEGAERLLGYHPLRWTTDPAFWAAHIHPDDRERTVAAFRRSATGRPLDVVHRFVHRDGSVRWLRCIGHVSQDLDGSLLRGVMVDVTDQQPPASSDDDVEVRYRQLIESLPAIVYTESVDENEVRVVFVSPQIRTLLGIDPQDWLGDTARWLASVHPDDREQIDEMNRVSEATGETFAAEYRIVAADGHEVWFHDESALIRDRDGRPLFWQGVMVDITERRRAEELEHALERERAETTELRALDELKSTFLQAVSHDLRTPLAAILGLAVTLERDDVQLSDEEAKDLAARIAANARKLDRMVRDLLDVERAGRGALEPTLSSADVGRLVEHIVAASDAPRLRHVEVSATSVTAEVDVAKVERIVENLMSNSIRHTPPEATVWVAVRDDGDGVLIAVDDAGPGVPAELHAEIFEPFRQGPNAPAHSPGVGIGLALVARFAELHGGSAWLQEREGGGASFRVWLPKRPPAGTG